LTNTTPIIAAPRARGLSLSVKVFLGTAAVVVVVLGATLFFTARSAGVVAEQSVERVLASARESMTAQIGGRAEGLSRATELFAGGAPFRATVAERDAANALDQVSVAVDEIRADWVQLTDREGFVLAKSNDTAAVGANLSGSSAIGLALEGEVVTAFGVEDNSLFELVVVPVDGPSDSRIGALMAVRTVRDDFAEAVKTSAAGQFEVLFYALDADDNPIVSAGTLPHSSLKPDDLAKLHTNALSDSASMRAELDVDETTYVATAGVLRSASGAPIGGYVLLRNRDAEFATIRAFERNLFIAGGLGILFAFLFSSLIARWVTRPVAKLADATRRASDGDYNAEITANSNDEIGSLATAFRRLLADLKEKQALVDFLGGAENAKTVQMKTMSLTSEQRIAEQGLVPGMTFANRYEVKEILGQGGMGTVFKAVDRELGEVIAIKTLKKDFLSQDPTALERFRGEIRLARRISHRNVVRTHDIGDHSGVYYITMECVEGKSLRALIKDRGRLPVAIALSVGKQLARALEIAHEQGVIHRDIKPHNMSVQADGVLKVMDFGIARLAERPQESGVTQAGMVVGTPEYMAPEQLMSGDIDARADLYAAGCVLYECLTGKTPITANTPYELVAKLIEEVPVSVRSLNPEVPEALDALIAQLLAKNPNDRVASATILHDRLASIG